MDKHLADETDTLAMGALIANACPENQFTIHLIGELGAGKTTFSRGFLIELGHQGIVKSPTYTLVEQYQVQKRVVFHFDLYRLSSAEELDFIGLDEYLNHNAICLIEWPEQGESYLPQPDLLLSLSYSDNDSRYANIKAVSDAGRQAYDTIITELNS